MGARVNSWAGSPLSKPEFLSWCVGYREAAVTQVALKTTARAWLSPESSGLSAFQLVSLAPPSHLASCSPSLVHRPDAGPPHRWSCCMQTAREWPMREAQERPVHPAPRARSWV